MTHDAFAGLLKRWRAARRLSQEQLALEAGVSTRHLSFLETGKSKPSREMVLRLTATLALALKERNVMLASAGFAPIFTARSLESLELAPVRRAIELLLQKQEPYGAVLFDRCWNVLRMNEGAARLMGCFLDPAHAAPGVATNLVRAILHPSGLRPALVNWVEVAQVALERLERECATEPTDEARRALLEEVRCYPGVDAVGPIAPEGGAPTSLVHLKRGRDEARLFTMLTTIGTPLDVTAQELTIESYFPADEATERWLQGR
ncbi:MAG: helix-turn-helix transcriptional regulator [Myxococcaceae bacterium]|nr:helix-turn-helix transcriptional regulator [Myxococcaceae bacterium]MCA3012047.1 helix-turn-helix transcriptional regulator [Myxococcaceae bacterium]